VKIKDTNHWKPFKPAVFLISICRARSEPLTATFDAYLKGEKGKEQRDKRLDERGKEIENERGKKGCKNERRKERGKEDV
jgi:hypothetical protein